MEASWSDDLQLVNKCCNLAFKAHHSGTDFSKDNSGRSSDIFAFRGSSSVEDWFSGDQLISESMEYSTSFPSLKVLGSGDSGILNRAFLQRFDQIMGDSQSQLRKEIERSLSLTEECSDKFPCCLNNKEDMEARLNLIAAREMERVREKNLATLNWYKNDINACLSKLQTYCTNCDNGIGYYDAFKVQQDKADFEANVTQLELIGYWEEVRELLKAFELPDLFEADRKWVELGTRIRFLVEPIDIANFYRHDKNEETNLYTTKSQARPNYYRYPERWLQHMRRFALENDPIMTNKERNLDSCFWARVENMCIGIKRNGFDSEKDEVSRFEEEVEKWLTEGALREHELKRPTFKNWWAMLPEEHKINSCIRNRMDQ